MLYLLEEIREGRVELRLVWAETHLVVLQPEVELESRPDPRLLLAPQPLQHVLDTSDQHFLELSIGRRVIFDLYFIFILLRK